MNAHTLYLVGKTNTPVFCGGFATREEAIAEGERRKANDGGFWPANPNSNWFRYFKATEAVANAYQMLMNQPIGADGKVVGS